MSVIVITPPVLPLISIDEARAHLRVDVGDEDTVVSGLIAAATRWIDGPDGILGRALVEQTLELRVPDFSDCSLGAHLPCPPTIAIVSVKYDDGDGMEQTMPSADYRLLGGSSGKFRLAPAYGKSWPSPRIDDEAVRIRYRAGYGTDPYLVPQDIRQAVLLLIGQWNENREAVKNGETVNKMPFAVEALLIKNLVMSL